MKANIIKYSLFLVILLLPLNLRSNNLLKKDSTEYSWDRFSFMLGGFLTSLNSDMQFGLKQLGTGVTINFEDALGLKTSNVVIRGELNYNFGV